LYLPSIVDVIGPADVVDDLSVSNVGVLPVGFIVVPGRLTTPELIWTGCPLNKTLTILFGATLP